MEELQIGDKTYISSKKAAQITGYAKDYVGQLCREGRVEARLVGRNWYILETAIREHRFGGATEGGEADPEPEIVAPEPVAPAVSPVAAWEAPRYVPEAPAYMPSIPTKSVETMAQESVTDMNSAWKEWFATRAQVEEPLELPNDTQQDPELLLEEETLEPVTAAEEEEEVALKRIHEPVEAPEEVVSIHRTHESRGEGEYIPEASETVIDLSHSVEPAPLQQIPIYQPAQKGGALILRSIFLAVAALSLVIAFLGSGLAESFFKVDLNKGISASAVNYLTGTISVKKD